MARLFTAQTANGSSSLFGHFAGRRRVNVYVAGVLDGATVAVEVRCPDGSTWVPLDGASTTVPTMLTVEAAAFVGRLTVSSAGLSTSVDAWVEEESQATEQAVSDALGG